MDLSNLFTNCHAYSAEQSTIDLLPSNQAAVYGFFDLLRTDGTKLTDSIDYLKTSHGRTLRLELDELPIHYRLRLRGKRTDNKTLKSIISKANKVIEADLFIRDTKMSNPFLDLLVDRGGRMNFAESVVDCARRILAIAFGSKANKDAVLSNYKEMTRRETKVIEEFWHEAEEL